MEEFLNSLDQILKHYKGERIAAFDLDDTLTEGDTGDAFFLFLKELEKITPLKEDGTKIPLTWDEYQELISSKGNEVAFSRVVSVMSGIRENKLIEVAENFFEIEDSVHPSGFSHIQLPIPNPVMVNLLEELKNRSFRNIIISASNRYIVKKSAELFFNIPAGDCFAITPVLKKEDGFNVLTPELEDPVPISFGKSQIYKKNFESPPLVTAGNSSTDIHLLNLVHPEGIPIWCHRDESSFQKMKKVVKSKINFTFFKRS